MSAQNIPGAAMGKEGERKAMRPSNGLTRRDFLRITGAGLAGASLFGLAGCGQERGGGVAGGDVWKQFKGTTLQFISENTPPTSAIAANLKPFKDRTGIDVKITQMELGALVEKVALDFGAGEGQYQVIYADPYQVLAPYYQGLAELNTFNEDDSLPSIPKDTGDFIPTQLDAAGKFESDEELYVPQGPLREVRRPDAAGPRLRSDAFGLLDLGPVLPDRQVVQR